MELVVLFLFSAGFWLLLIRPQQQRLRAQRDLIASLNVGDRIVTAGGLIGTVVALDDRDADIEVAPGVVLKFLRPAISRRLDPEEEGAAPGLLQPTGTGEADEADAGRPATADEPAATDEPAPAGQPATGGQPAAPQPHPPQPNAPQPQPHPPQPTAGAASAGDDDIEEGTH